MASRKPNLTVISGGGGGIGTAVVHQLCGRDSHSLVALIDLDFPSRDALTASFGRRVTFHECDVTVPPQVTAVVAAIVQAEHSSLALVNGAGRVSNTPSLELSVETWRSVVDSHLTGAFILTQAIARVMANEGGGAIVNIGSIAGLFGHPRRLPYSVAKAGLHQMARTLAVEWADYNIRVNAVAPGFVETPMFTRVRELGLIDAEAAANLHAMKRVAEPREIAAAIVFLLDDDAGFITGETLVVDGGYSVYKAT